MLIKTKNSIISRVGSCHKWYSNINFNIGIRQSTTFIICILYSSLYTSCKSAIIFERNKDESTFQTVVIGGESRKKVSTGFYKYQGSDDLVNEIKSKSKRHFKFAPITDDKNYGSFAIVTKKSQKKYGVEFYWFSHNGQFRHDGSTLEFSNPIEIQWLNEYTLLIIDKRNLDNVKKIILRRDDGTPPHWNQINS